MIKVFTGVGRDNTVPKTGATSAHEGDPGVAVSARSWLEAGRKMRIASAGAALQPMSAIASKLASVTNGGAQEARSTANDTALALAPNPVHARKWYD